MNFSLKFLGRLLIFFFLKFIIIYLLDLISCKDDILLQHKRSIHLEEPWQLATGKCTLEIPFLIELMVSFAGYISNRPSVAGAVL